MNSFVVMRTTNMLLRCVVTHSEMAFLPAPGRAVLPASCDLHAIEPSSSAAACCMMHGDGDGHCSTYSIKLT